MLGFSCHSSSPPLTPPRISSVVSSWNIPGMQEVKQTMKAVEIATTAGFVFD